MTSQYTVRIYVMFQYFSLGHVCSIGCLRPFPVGSCFVLTLKVCRCAWCCVSTVEEVFHLLDTSTLNTVVFAASPVLGSSDSGHLLSQTVIMQSTGKGSSASVPTSVSFPF